MALEGKEVALLAEDLYEDLELWYPYYRLKEERAQVTILGTGKDRYTSKHGLAVFPDVQVASAAPSAFDGVVIPGGYAPDKMRRHRPLIDFVRGIAAQGKPVAFICHAGWVPVSADIVRGRRVTSAVSIRDDLVNAGGVWMDQEVVGDANLISSRSPGDLPAFCRALISALQTGPRNI